MTTTKYEQFFRKYASVISLITLGFQYAVLVMFPDHFDKEVLRQYIFLWTTDINMGLVIFILLFIPTKSRIVICSLFLFLFVLRFHDKLLVNSIYFNTLITIGLRYKFLFFPISDERKKTGFIEVYRKPLVVFVVLLFVLPLESVLKSFGLIHREPAAEGAKVMSTFTAVLMFIGYYLLLAYFEYRKIKNIEKAG